MSNNSNEAGDTAYLESFGLTIYLDKKQHIGTIVLMKIIADTNTFLAVALYEPEREKIIRLTLGHDLVAPDISPRTGLQRDWM